jgi:hypothetical protein
MYADLHAHSFLSSFEQRVNNDIKMSINPNDENSVWHQFPEENNIVDWIAKQVGFTTYSESDFTQSALCGVCLINVAIYPPERGFFKLDDKTLLEKIINWLGLTNFAEKELGHLISGFSIENIEFMKSGKYDYFQDTLGQISFITKAISFQPDPAGCVGSLYSSIKNASYVLLQNRYQLNTALPDQLIQIVLSVEGGNAFWSNITSAGNLWNGTNFDSFFNNAQVQAYQALNVYDWRNAITRDIVENNADAFTPFIPQDVCTAVMQNVQQLLSQTKLFSYTIAHHFYNGLCGHCASLQPLTQHQLVDQSFGLGSDITNLGYMVINELLKNNVIVDVKHMSWNARQSYYRFRANNYPQIPIISSHSAVNGLKWMGGQEWSNSLGLNNPFYQEELNLYDDDIYEIVRSGGLIGILMDQRVNGVKNQDTNVYALHTLWLQFQYIAERAAECTKRSSTQTAWDNICLGTDYDGVIHPVDEFRMYDDFVANGSSQTFYDFLLQNAAACMQNPPASFLPTDMLPPEQIVAKICYRNMSDFVQKYYS